MTDTFVYDPTALDFQENLSSIYRFVATRLTSASITGNVQQAREAERAFAPIADAFVQAVALQGGK